MTNSGSKKKKPSSLLLSPKSSGSTDDLMTTASTDTTTTKPTTMSPLARAAVGLGCALRFHRGNRRMRNNGRDDKDDDHLDLDDDDDDDGEGEGEEGPGRHHPDVASSPSGSPMDDGIALPPPTPPPPTSPTTKTTTTNTAAASSAAAVVPPWSSATARRPPAVPSSPRGGGLRSPSPPSFSARGGATSSTTGHRATTTTTTTTMTSSSSRRPPLIAGRASTASSSSSSSSMMTTAASSSSSSIPHRRSRSALTPSDVHYLANSDSDGPANSPFVPLSKHYDANDALLGLFASSLYHGKDGGGGGDASLAYAVGTRFVEVALYRIPKHGYYRSGREGRRRTRAAADAMWVTGLLGGMMTSASEVMGEKEGGGEVVVGGGGRRDDDDRIATLRRLAREARKSFEEALNDEGGGGDDDDDGGGGGGGGGIRRQRNDDNEVKENGVDINDNDDDRGGKDVLGTWREYILGGGGGGRCYDGVFFDGATMCSTLPDNICTFWNNVGSFSASASTEEGGRGGTRKRQSETKKKRGKIDRDSLPKPPRPIEIPQVFIKREISEEEAVPECDDADDDLDVTDARPGVTNDIHTLPTTRRVKRHPSPLNDGTANDRMAMEVDDRSVITPSTHRDRYSEASPRSFPTAYDSDAATLVEGDARGVKSAVVVRGGEMRQLHHHHRSIDSHGFDEDALRLALSLSMRDDGEPNVVSSSSSRSSGEVTDGSMSGVVAGEGNFVPVESMASLYREQYLALRENRKFHVRFLETYQGRNPLTTNGCTVIAPLTCVQYFMSGEGNVVEASPSVEYVWRDGIPDGLINHVIDEHAASILPDVRGKLRLERDAFIIPSDVHDHLIEVGLLSTSQFVGVCGGNVLDDDHLQAFKSSLLLSDDLRERERLRGRKVAATFFFHGHVVALHVVRRNGSDDDGNAWIELIDSLPNPETWIVDPRRSSTSTSSNVWADPPGIVGSRSSPRWSGRETDDEWECVPEYEDGDDDHELPLNAVRVRCTDVEHFDTLIRHYACSKFSDEERQFIDGTAWEDNNGYCEYSFDPRVFQAFIWAESE